MREKLLMGNQAIALGAIAAGVNVVCGYPGTPSTEVLETVAKNNDGSIYVEWSVNEKVALEVGAGASYAGARTLVTMKQVGLNVASDPLMSLAYIGVKGGMVILVADDPGPISSQTEQDTRHFAENANLPVLDPTSPEEAYLMVQFAFVLSEKYHLPVFLRPTTRICHACATVMLNDNSKIHPITGFEKSPQWVIFPQLSYRKHIEIEEKQKELSAEFANSPYNTLTQGGRLGVCASGIAYANAKEAILKHHLDITLLKIGTPYPFPSTLGDRLLQSVDSVLVLEELDGMNENALIILCAKNHRNTKIYGKETGHVPYAGEYTYELVERALLCYCGKETEPKEDLMTDLPALPARPPVLCAGCPHRASFYTVKQALRGQKAIFTGDIGCYTLGNAQPLDMTDTCLCMGAGITVAQGLQHTQPDTKLIAFIGDSTFIHSGIPGVINAVYNQSDLTIAVLDNSTTAMTGHQPHPGTGRTMMNTDSPKADIEAILRACKVEVTVLDPFDFENAVKTIKEIVSCRGVKAIVFKAPCIANASESTAGKKKQQFKVDESCIGCKRCIHEIGCPAIFFENGKAKINRGLCFGCGLCTYLCPKHCIVAAEEGTV